MSLLLERKIDNFICYCIKSWCTRFSLIHMFNYIHSYAFADDETIIHLILSCIREKTFHNHQRDYFEEINITDMDGKI
jgi:hypothetical protein